VWKWDWQSDPGRNLVLKYFISEAHKRGMKVIFQDLPWAINAHTEQGIPVLPEWDALATRASDSLPSIIPAPTAQGAYDLNRAWNIWLCPTSPFLASAMVHVLPRVMTDLRVDAFINDWVFYGWGCKGEELPKAFQEDTGQVLPSPSVLSAGSSEQAVFRAWRDWSAGGVLLRATTDLKKALKAADPDKILFAYISRVTRGEYETYPAFADMLGDEASVRSPFYEWSWHLATLKYNFAVSSLYNVPVYELYYTGSLSEHFFNWALTHTVGLKLWRTPSAFNLWESQHAEILDQPRPLRADAAVLYSRQTFTRYSEFDAANLKGPDAGPRPYEESRYNGSEEGGYGWAGWARVLQDRHIPYDVVLDTDLNREILSSYRVLILANAAALSDGQTQTIREFVRSGGTLISDYQTSLFDETGERRSDFALSDVIGGHYVKLRPPRWSWYLESASRVPASYFSSQLLARTAEGRENQFVAEIEPIGGTQTLAWYQSGTSRIPALVFNAYGRGRSLYFAGYPGSRTFFRRQVQNRPDLETGFTYNDYSSPFYLQLLSDTLVNVLPDPYLVTDAPPEILVNGLRLSDSGTGKLCIHVLNALGSRPANGTVLKTVSGDDPFTGFPYPPDVTPPKWSKKKGYPVPFPDYSQPITIKIKDSAFKGGQLLSPDYPQAQPVKLSRDGNYTVVTIPGLKRYAIIVLDYRDRERRRP
jgi:hypothetical protein